ncbi:MAG: M20 family metallopeptidase [Pirellulales bacterium]|nr:M20 family metallopeptidase [Pirellulales bacterium]
MKLQATDTLRELVSIPSVNPMGRAVDGDIFFEHRVTDYLQQQFERMGLRFARQFVAPSRENIVARLDATEAPDQAPIMLWEVHQDTVPVDGMTIEPFHPQATSERISGRGACDVKGSMAAMLAALSELVKVSRRPVNIVIACTVNEEYGYSGARKLVELWEPNAPQVNEFTNLLDRKPDVAIIAEPTEMNVVVAHKGAIRWRITTHGKACHSSNPGSGRNAIYLMGPVLEALESYHADIQQTGRNHPFCGRPTTSVGLISGGVSVNTVPDQCVIEVDRRVTPGETPVEARDEVIAYVDDFLRRKSENDQVSQHAPILLDGGLSHAKPHLIGWPLENVGNENLAEFVRSHAATVHGESQIMGVSFGTDGAVIGATGVPSVVFGPGSISQAHTCDEWISVAQLNDAVKIYLRLANSFEMSRSA